MGRILFAGQVTVYSRPIFCSVSIEMKTIVKGSLVVASYVVSIVGTLVDCGCEVFAKWCRGARLVRDWVQRYGVFVAKYCNKRNLPKETEVLMQPNCPNGVWLFLRVGGWIVLY